MFAYCNNNPVDQTDHDGCAAETVWDIISLAASVAEVAMNPSDPWAWAGLVGDVIDVAIPFVGGIGEVARAAKTTVRVIESADDTIDAAKAFRRASDVASDVRQSTGAYVVLYESGKSYVGKGGFDRAVQSAANHLLDDAEDVSAIIWAPTATSREAFAAEYLLQTVTGVGGANPKTYNKIWSPGRNLLNRIF